MNSSGDDSEKKLQRHGPTFEAKEIDVAAQLAAGADDLPLDPAYVARLRMQFADKTTLSQASVLGILQDAHLTRDQFNWLGTIFYISFLVFEYPQNLGLQHFPVGKWMSTDVSCCLQLLRWIICSAITAGFMLVTAMFYTREEQSRRIGYWYLMNGTALIVLGLVSFGVAHTNTPQFSPWKWLFFPDSPSNARFLTPEERILAVQRIKVNQAGIENKRWKREQFIEAMTDPKTWLLCLYAALGSIWNSFGVQRQIIVSQFGFSLFQTTLLGCVDGVVEILVILVGVALVPKFGRTVTSVGFYIFAILGSILLQTLPFSNKVGLLFGYWLNIFAVTPFVISLGWTNAIVAGHTKRTTVNAVFFVAYGIGNAASPLMFKAEYAPRFVAPPSSLNRVPMAVIAASNFAAALVLVLLRIVLARENKRRDREQRDETYDDAYVKKELPDGTIVVVKVDKAFLDLTDKQNRDFRYVL
ncbi:Major facilitator superfamily domain containing protein [Amanita muscaria]